MKIVVIVEGKFESVWKEVRRIEVDLGDLPHAETFKQKVKGWFGIKATLIERVTVKKV